jgi:hypothetical protein
MTTPTNLRLTRAQLEAKIVVCRAKLRVALKPLGFAIFKQTDSWRGHAEARKKGLSPVSFRFDGFGRHDGYGYSHATTYESVCFNIVKRSYARHAPDGQRFRTLDFSDREDDRGVRREVHCYGRARARDG